MAFVDGANVVAISFALRFRVFGLLNSVQEIKSAQRFGEHPASFRINNLFY
jgi:hypothetical protein